MINNQSIIETKDRLKVLQRIDDYVKSSSLSGLLVTGSVAWGKNHAVTDASDIDFYLLAPSLESFRSALMEFPELPQETKLIFMKLLNFDKNHIDTRSMKTCIGQYHGAIYLFTEKELTDLCDKFEIGQSKFFNNLRPHSNSQTKEYKDLDGNIFTFTTAISKADDNNGLWIRTDPLVLFELQQFYGSIFLSHLLFGEIYTDKNQILKSVQKRASLFLKQLLPKEKDSAFIAFKNYLPRIERMNNDTINALFESVWLA